MHFKIAQKATKYLGYFCLKNFPTRCHKSPNVVTMLGKILLDTNVFFISRTGNFGISWVGQESSWVCCPNRYFQRNWFFVQNRSTFSSPSWMERCPDLKVNNDTPYHVCMNSLAVFIKGAYHLCYPWCLIHCGTKNVFVERERRGINRANDWSYKKETQTITYTSNHWVKVDVARFAYFLFWTTLIC